MARVVLEQISSQTFEHAADRAALEALRRTMGFETLVRGLARLADDRIWTVVNESSNLRCSERQCPALHGLLLEAARVLDLAPPPLYLQHDVRLNAFTAGVERPFVVVTSGLVEALSDEELIYVLGHELGHVLAGHVLYGMVARSLETLLLGVGAMFVPPVIGRVLRLSMFTTLMYWRRCAELTADRCGLLTVQDPQVALRTILKLCAGPGARVARGLDLEAFLEQARRVEEEDSATLESLWRAVLEHERTHPWPVTRARELERWVSAGSLGQVLSGRFQRRASAVLAAAERPRDLGDATEAFAAEAEGAVRRALSRAYGVHLAPRIPEAMLAAALSSYADTLDPGERVVALYDRSLSGGERGLLLTDRRACSSSRPRHGVYYRDVRAVKRGGDGFLATPTVEVEGLSAELHTRALRDAFAAALVAAAGAFRGGPPPLD